MKNFLILIMLSWKNEAGEYKEPRLVKVEAEPGTSEEALASAASDKALDYFNRVYAEHGNELISIVPLETIQ